MGVCYPISLIPISRELVDAAGVVTDTSTSTWFVFPDEVRERMAEILVPYGYQNDSDVLPDAEHFLGQIEYMCRDEAGRNPWAIIFYAAEYPLAGHLLSIRPNRELRFSNYSICHPHWQERNEGGPPLLSIVFVFSKRALKEAVATGSPLLKEAFGLLTDKPERGAWVVIADPLDSSWVQATAKESDA